MSIVSELLFPATIGQILFHLRQLGVVDRRHNLKNKVTRKTPLKLNGNPDAPVAAHERGTLHLQDH